MRATGWVLVISVFVLYVFDSFYTVLFTVTAILALEFKTSDLIHAVLSGLARLAPLPVIAESACGRQHC